MVAGGSLGQQLEIRPQNCFEWLVGQQSGPEPCWYKLSLLASTCGRGRKVQTKPEGERTAKLGSGDLSIHMRRKLFAPVCVNDLRPTAQASSM